MNVRIIKYFSVFLVMLFTFSTVSGENWKHDKDAKKNNALYKPNGEPVYTKFNINNISTWVKNDGETDINQNGNSGFVFPAGSNKAAIFQSGFLWGGLVDGEKRVGGSVYRQGTVPGKILNEGVPWQQLQAEDPGAEHVRIYRVRPDYETAALSEEVNDGDGTYAQVYAQYELDWMNWPAEDGAPYTDVDSNGVYDPNVDIPGVPGADQTIWFVANDTNPDQTEFMYGSQPIGIEEQVTVWGYRRTGALGNMLFRKFIIINKSNSTVDSMYVSMWSDPDVGDANDDFVGSDTTLSLGFAYNANARDATYGTTPPAAGFDFFQGPIVDGDPDEFAIFDGKRIFGKKNLPMTAFYFFINSDPIYTDPEQGAYEGTIQFYNLFQGKVSTTGEPFTTPTGEQTQFTLTGDPKTGEGWVDGELHPPGDRRMGMVSGPFTMAPGDTQEVVVAEIAAGAFGNVDRLSALDLLKFYDLQAQLVYDNLFQVAAPPAQPIVKTIETDQQISLFWGENKEAVAATENHDSFGYEFEGYNVYQLPNANATIEDARRIATFDLKNGVAKIIGPEFDPEGGAVLDRVLQFGSDSGIKRHLVIENDAFNSNLPLVNGQRYYFAVTSYAYNDDPEAVPNVIENPVSPIMVVPQTNDPGVTSAETEGLIEFEHNGTADGGPIIEVVDPSALTGHTYEVFFTERQEIRNENGNWVPAASVNKFGPDTVSGSTVDISAVYGETGDVYQLNFSLNIVSVTFAWVDGITMTLPPNINIIEAPDIAAGGGTVIPEINGNVVKLGLTDDSRTEAGVFHGGETWSFIVEPFDPPATFEWEIHDDGYQGAPLNETGTSTVNEVGNISRLAQYWNLRDVTAGEVLLENMSVVNGFDLYPDRDDIITDLGNEAAPIVDGFQIWVDVGYEAPITFRSAELVEDPGGNTSLTSSSNTEALDIQNYTIFSGVVSSKAIDNFGVGTNELLELQQDYEYRFTGVWDSMQVGDQTVHYVESGGQMATVFRMISGGALATNPLNPNPGVAEPFLVRIPFEVWNVSDPENPYQVNFAFRHRESDGTEEVFYSWPQSARAYGIIINSEYNPEQVIPIDSGPSDLNNPATWVTVHYGTNYDLGAVVKLTYANPIQFGVDTYTFQTQSVSFSQDKAVEDVANINVFPNPYYGVNPQEINKYQRFVTFSHLPEKATIRILNLAGQLVRTIQKDDDSQFQRWDLLNDSGLPVASGLYIVYFDMPDIGATKIVKVAIIQEEQILDRF